MTSKLEYSVVRVVESRLLIVTPAATATEDQELSRCQSDVERTRTVNAALTSTTVNL
jgi:hypothetical protein